MRRSAEPITKLRQRIDMIRLLAAGVSRDLAVLVTARPIVARTIGMLADDMSACLDELERAARTDEITELLATATLEARQAVAS